MKMWYFELGWLLFGTISFVIYFKQKDAVMMGASLFILWGLSMEQIIMLCEKLKK